MNKNNFLALFTISLGIIFNLSASNFDNSSVETNCKDKKTRKSNFRISYISLTLEEELERLKNDNQLRQKYNDNNPTKKRIALHNIHAIEHRMNWLKARNAIKADRF